MKILKKISYLSVMFLILFLIIRGVKVDADSSTAFAKGFEINNMVYISDRELFAQEIKTDDYLYGKVSMWAGVYYCDIKNQNGKMSRYVTVFIESSIDSVGKVGKKRYFRNKELKVDVQFDCRNLVHLVNYTNGSNDAQTSLSKTIGFSASGAIEVSGNGPSASSNFSSSFSMTKSQSYSTVNLCVDNNKIEDRNGIVTTFDYQFTKWKDGKMISPNIKEVKERMYLVYELDDYDETGFDAFDLTISTTATIFKDAKWPLPNGTKSRTLTFNGYNGNI